MVDIYQNRLAETILMDSQDVVLRQNDAADLGDNCIQFVIWGGISSDIRSEILLYGDALAEL